MKRDIKDFNSFVMLNENNQLIGGSDEENVKLLKQKGKEYNELKDKLYSVCVDIEKISQTVNNNTKISKLASITSELQYIFSKNTLRYFLFGGDGEIFKCEREFNNYLNDLSSITLDIPNLPDIPQPPLELGEIGLETINYLFDILKKGNMGYILGHYYINTPRKDGVYLIDMDRNETSIKQTESLRIGLVKFFKLMRKLEAKDEFGRPLEVRDNRYKNIRIVEYNNYKEEFRQYSDYFYENTGYSLQSLKSRGEIYILFWKGDPKNIKFTIPAGLKGIEL